MMWRYVFALTTCRHDMQRDKLFRADRWSACSSKWRSRLCNLSSKRDVTIHLKIKLASCLCIFKICASNPRRCLLIIMTNVSVVLLCHSCQKKKKSRLKWMAIRIPVIFTVSVGCSLQLMWLCDVTDAPNVREWSRTGECVQRHLLHSTVTNTASGDLQQKRARQSDKYLN